VALSGFPAAARRSLADSQLRANLARATSTIRDKRGRAVDEVPDWEELREAGAAIKDAALLRLDSTLETLESSVTAAGGVVHWAKDGDEACSIVASLARSHGVDEVVKVKSIATDEIGLNEHLAAEGISAVETDLAELIIQLDDDHPSHILVPAIHRNRAEIRDIFIRELGEREPGADALTDEPGALTEAARVHLRAKFLSARMGVSGANFGVAETGSVCVFESEGNGRMCTTLPEVLVTVMGIEKVIPTWRDMEVFLQLLPRSSTAERLNPYTSIWSGTAARTAGGEGAGSDGPREFHLVLLDNGRVQTLADEVGRQALRCIRCSACLNVCPVYARVGGHAYGSVYPGPIGAILTPQLRGIENARSLPYASSLCGACGEVCPVKIEIPRLLTHLRAREVASRRRLDPEKLTMRALFHTFSSRSRYERAQKLARTAARPFGSKISNAPPPLAGWTTSRDLPTPAKESFREWWRRTRGSGTGEGAPAGASHPEARTAGTMSAFSPHIGANADTVSYLGPHNGQKYDTVAASGPEAPAGPGGDARTDILHRIRSALADAAPPDVPRNYRTKDERERDEIVTVFAERVAEYRATVHRVAEAEVGETVERIAEEAGARRIGIPGDLPEEWRRGGSAEEGSSGVAGPGAALQLVEDASLSVQDLDALDGALTGCALGVAEVGAFVLDGGPGQGRRALSLVPDLHICVVREDQVVGLVPEAVRQLGESVRAGRPLTFVAGPSATSDIELDRVEGVHGPRTLHVVVVAAG
jgi:L-lactate dehydrogenase complex protein LldF